MVLPETPFSPAYGAPAGGTIDVTTTAGSLSRTLAPGSYRNIALCSGSILNLSAGAYVFTHCCPVISRITTIGYKDGVFCFSRNAPKTAIT